MLQTELFRNCRIHDAEFIMLSEFVMPLNEFVMPPDLLPIRSRALRMSACTLSLQHRLTNTHAYFVLHALGAVRGNWLQVTLTATLHITSLQPAFPAAAFNLLFPTPVIRLPILPNQNKTKQVSNPAANSHSNKATAPVYPRRTHIKEFSFVEGSTPANFAAPTSPILL